MLVHTRGLVLSQFNYGENSLVLKVYTEAQGIKSYILEKSKAQKRRANKVAPYQPLYLLDMVTYWQEKYTFGRINECQVLRPFHHTLLHPHKRALALFILEILLKSLKEEEANEPLFAFLVYSFEWLDAASDSQFDCFHLVFLVNLAAFLGFGLTDVEVLLAQSNINEHIDEEHLQILTRLLTCEYDELEQIPNKSKYLLLSILIGFYQINIPDFGTIKSLAVLREIFR
ncbi:MAG: DNA repair protein RecO [Cytophagales bacterium]|nr:MAG: DNA repair protein RecO [Cytophagales bacterium]TAF61546.1 MAG: DNA repair protein RecO [Cytophagales bacterium]